MHWLLRLIGFYQPARILRQPNQSRLFKGGGTRCTVVALFRYCPSLSTLACHRGNQPLGSGVATQPLLAFTAFAFPPIFYQSEDSAAAAAGAADLPMPKSSAALGLEPPKG